MLFGYLEHSGEGGQRERMGDLHLGEDFNRMPLPRFRTMHTLEILSSALSFTDKTPSCAPWKWSENLDHFWPTNGRDRWKCRNPPPLKYFLALEIREVVYYTVLRPSLCRLFGPH